MSKVYPINVLIKGVVLRGELISAWQKPDEISLSYQYDNKRYLATHKFPFFALVEIRKELEIVGGLLMCNGARRDVYPSGMSMSGVMAYVLVLGKQAGSPISIFDPCKDVKKLSTIAEQKNHWNTWIQGFRR